MDQTIDQEYQQTRCIIAGMLSTINYTPSELHPSNMLNMADAVIHHLRLLDSEIRNIAIDGRAETPEGPFEGQHDHY